MFPEWHHAVPESAYFKLPETLKTFRMQGRLGSIGTWGPLGQPLQYKISNKQSPSDAIFWKLGNPHCTRALEQRRLCNTKRWASENNFSILHRKFKALYSEPPHSVAFGACDDPTTATKLGLYGLHLELRNKIAMHMFIEYVRIFVAW